MNMLEKAIVSVRGTDIEPVLRCEISMGFGDELKGSVPADYMTCDEEEVSGRASFGRRISVVYACALLCYVPRRETLSLFLFSPRAGGKRVSSFGTKDRP